MGERTMNMRRSQLTIFTWIWALAAGAIGDAAAAGGYPTWSRPTEALDGVAPGIYDYEVLSYYVERSGRYSAELLHGAQYDGFLVVYAGEFDPADPLKNAVAANDDGPGGAGSSRVTLDMASGVLYRFVATTKAPIPFPPFPADLHTAPSFTGPGPVRLSSHFIGDELLLTDRDSTHVGMGPGVVGFCWLGGRFRVQVQVDDPLAGPPFLARPVQRTRDSVLFSFFEDDNWEVLVKLVDGCAVNGRYWFFVSASTSLSYHLSIEDCNSQSLAFETVGGAASDGFADLQTFSDACTNSTAD